MKVPDLPEEALAYGRLFDRTKLSDKMTWCGWTVQKTPADMWVYQEIIAATKPDLLVEIGSGYGGTALFFACVMESFGKGRVLSFDPKPKGLKFGIPTPKHPRLKFVTDDARLHVDRVRRAVKLGDRLMVIEDANHTYSVTSGCLEVFSPLVARDCYYVVEDTDRHRGEGNNVWRAVCDFLEQNPKWEIDWAAEKYYHTTCHGGFLRRRTK